MTDGVIIVGAGLAGLCCAHQLQQRGIPFQLIEAADGVGGRIRTDVMDGFRLDRGFQVLLTSYPEAKHLLNFDALRLCPFLPGALVRHDGKFHQVTDPWRRPTAALTAAFSPIGSLADKMRMSSLRAQTLEGSIEDQFRAPEMTTLQALQEAGFSAGMIDSFFRPFLGGIFLEADLATSSRFFHFIFRMFAVGSACLPLEGMEQIPRQLAAFLPADSIRLNTRVVQVAAGQVTLATGEVIQSRAVVVATDAPAAARLLDAPPGNDAIQRAGQGVTNLYFAAPEAPVAEPILVLNGEGKGPINNLCVPTTVAPAYGPSDAALVSVSVLGTDHDADALEVAVRAQLAEWYGPAAQSWRHLRTYTIPYALPRQAPPALDNPERAVRWQPGLYVCGDHRDTASIQGAMVSGRRAADAVIEDMP